MKFVVIKEHQIESFSSQQEAVDYAYELCPRDMARVWLRDHPIENGRKTLMTIGPVSVYEIAEEPVTC